MLHHHQGKKSKTTYRVQIVDSNEDEEKTCLEERGGGDGKEFQATNIG